MIVITIYNNNSWSKPFPVMGFVKKHLDTADDSKEFTDFPGSIIESDGIPTALLMLKSGQISFKVSLKS